MGIFNSIFGNSEEYKNTESKINWIPLTDLDQLNEIVVSSNEKPVAIFKHSTRCSISRMALRQFENKFDSEDKVETYFLDLIANRAVSNEVADRFQVMHESPQLLLIKNGISVYNVSHSDIDAIELKNVLD